VSEPTDSGDDAPVCVNRGACCKHSPGWFGPGEAERAAEHLGLEIGDFVQRYLILDNVMVGNLRVEVFAPVKADDDGNPVEGPNVRISRVYHFMSGACIFYDAAGKACGIHAARPIECRHYFCQQPEERNLSKEAIGSMWLDARPGQE
jgi:Fe-S-cluster containining protein